MSASSATAPAAKRLRLDDVKEYAAAEETDRAWLPRASPESCGLCSKQLSRLDAFYRGFVVPSKDHGPRLAGTVVAVARRGRLVHLNVVGEAVLGRFAMRHDTIFRIFSMTKPITVVTLMTFWEEGRFLLDDPIAKFIPAFEDQKVYVPGAKDYERAHRDITIRDLCTHTAGLCYGWGDTPVDEYYKQNNISVSRHTVDYDLETLCDKLGAAPKLFQPGTRYCYGMATDVLGRLVEILAGEPLDFVMKKRVLGPLQMVDTDFIVPPEKLHRFAACYEVPDNGSLQVWHGEDYPFTSSSVYLTRPKLLGGGGGLCGTTADYLRFAQMMLNGGELDGVRILGPRTVKFIASNHLPGSVTVPELGFAPGYSETSFPGVGYGLGGAVMVDPVAHGFASGEGMYYWAGMAATSFFIDFKEGIAAVLMTQRIGSPITALRPALRNIIHAAIRD